MTSAAWRLQPLFPAGVRHRIPRLRAPVLAERLSGSCQPEHAVAEELDFFVRSRGDVVWSCELDFQGTVIAARLIGQLDPAQRVTFNAVLESGAISAPELATRFADAGIGTTAWNNRLSALANKGLLVERRQGKSKLFSPLLEVG